MIKPVITILIQLLLFSINVQCQTSNRGKTTELTTGNIPEDIKKANIKKASNTQFQYFIIKTGVGGYGYRIYADGNLYIEQNTIPANAGKRGFADTLTAGKCAKLVIQKIKLGEMPPTLTKEDLIKHNLITN